MPSYNWQNSFPLVWVKWSLVRLLSFFVIVFIPHSSNKYLLSSSYFHGIWFHRAVSPCILLCSQCWPSEWHLLTWYSKSWFHFSAFSSMACLWQPPSCTVFGQCTSALIWGSMEWFWLVGRIFESGCMYSSLFGMWKGVRLASGSQWDWLYRGSHDYCIR